MAIRNNIYPGDAVSYIRKDGTIANQCFYVQIDLVGKTPETILVDVLDTETGHKGIKTVPLSCLTLKAKEADK